MNSPAKSLEEIIQELSPQLRREVQTFAEHLLLRAKSEKSQKLRQDWAGKLTTEPHVYTSVELQHLAMNWRE